MTVPVEFGSNPPDGDTRRGAFVVSLDFELHWGVRDALSCSGPYRENLLGVWRAVPALLRLFDSYGIRATWATVGLLFARSEEEMKSFIPSVLPAYQDIELSPYGQPVGHSEQDDPLHYAPSLIEAVLATPGQEIATHTFSHYYCLEKGNTPEAFAADLESALAISRRWGVDVRSIVFPRNQYNAGYDDILREAGVTCYRGVQAGWMYSTSGGLKANPAVRLGRLADSYLPIAGSGNATWEELRQESGLCNVRASRFLRPYSPRIRDLERIRLRRIESGLRRAALAGEIFHLWWHPHNFGVHLKENLELLRHVLDRFAELRSKYGIESLTMAEVADQACKGQAAFQ